MNSPKNIFPWEENFDFEALLKPDADFEKRVSEVPIESPKIERWNSSFPELILDDTEILKEEEQWVNPRWQQQVPEKKAIQENREVLSEIEQKISFYSLKFQEILQSDKNETLQDSLKRYARFLIYLLEQFEITEGKKHHIKFMIELKKVIGEIQTPSKVLWYIKQIEKKWLYKTWWKLREELEFLYSIYYQNYIQTQKELHKKEVDERKKLYNEITSIQEELLGEGTFENHLPPQSIEGKQDIVEVIRQKRLKIEQKRAQRKITNKW